MPVERVSDTTYTVRTTLTRQFSVSIVDDYFTSGAPDLVLHTTRSRKRIVVIDKNVEHHYGQHIYAFLDRYGIDYTPVAVELSEATKTVESMIGIFDELKRVGVDRRSEPVIAIGGGVVTDAVGLAASLDGRGKPWVRIVTTGQMIDAGTSAKTGVNRFGKSGLGTFHAPVQTIVDRRFLRTLPDRHVRDMMAEAVKLAVMRDAELFELLERRGGTLIAERLQGKTPETDHAARVFLHRCVYGTLDENADNLEESNLERRMHFGHTWGPKLEIAALGTPCEVLHGQGVSIDIALSAALSYYRGLLDEAGRDRIIGVLRSFGLPVWHQFLADEQMMASATASATRAHGGALLAPLPYGIGDCVFVNDVTATEIRRAVAWLRAVAGAR